MDCQILNAELVGQNANDGESVNYNCINLTTLGNPKESNYTLNTDVSLIVVGENGSIDSYDFNHVNFNGDADEESTSIQEHSEYIYYLFIIEEAIFILITLFWQLMENYSSCGRNLQENGDKVTLKIRDENNETKSYTRTISGEEENSDCDLTCDTTGN